MSFYLFEIAANVLQTAVYIVILVLGSRKFMQCPSLPLGLFLIATASLAIGDFYWISLLYLGSDSVRSFSASDISEIGNMLLLYSMMKIRLDRSAIRSLFCPGTVLAAVFGLIVAVLWTFWSVPLIATVPEIVLMVLLSCVSVLELEVKRPIPKRAVTTVALFLAAAAFIQFILLHVSGASYTGLDMAGSLLMNVLVLLLIIASLRVPGQRFPAGMLAFVAANYAQSMCIGFFYSLSMMLVTLSYALLFLGIGETEEEVSV